MLGHELRRMADASACLGSYQERYGEEDRK